MSNVGIPRNRKDINVAATYNWTGDHDFGAELALSGDISPASLAVNQDNYAPTGITGASIIRQDCSASVDITGLTDGSDGRLIIFHNISATNTITLKHDVTSTAANRFYCSNNGDLPLGPNESALLVYDATSLRWRTFGTGGLSVAEVVALISGATLTGGLTMGGVLDMASNNIIGIADLVGDNSGNLQISQNNTSSIQLYQQGAGEVQVWTNATQALTVKSDQVIRIDNGDLDLNSNDIVNAKSIAMQGSAASDGQISAKTNATSFYFGNFGAPTGTLAGISKIGNKILEFEEASLNTRFYGDADLNGNDLLAVNSIKLNATTSLISTDTADTADNKTLQLAGGGSAGVTRGAYVNLYGNEGTAGSEGRVQILAGNDAADGTIRMYTGAASERLRIDYGGEINALADVDLNSNNINNAGDVTASGVIKSTQSGAALADSSFLAEAASPSFHLKNTSGAVDEKSWEILSSASSLTIRTLNDARTTSNTALSISRSGSSPSVTSILTDVSLSSNDITNVNSIGLTGGQIAFPATQNPSADANTLDDYEEGNFTPVIWDNTLSSGEGQTYSRQVGTYTKIGRVVHYKLWLTITSLGTLTTSEGARIGGLPFTSSSTVSTYSSISCGYANGLSVTAGNSVGGYIANNVSYIDLTLWDLSSGISTLLLSELTGSGNLMIEGHYEI